MARKRIPYNDFGINSNVIPWTEEDGTVHEAVLLRPFVTLRHSISTVLGNRVNG